MNGTTEHTPYTKDVPCDCGGLSRILARPCGCQEICFHGHSKGCNNPNRLMVIGTVIKSCGQPGPAKDHMPIDSNGNGAEAKEEGDRVWNRVWNRILPIVVRPWRKH
jgi:hypothetical protein